MLKKVYVEITNSCNLSCDFCIKNNRPINFITLDEFKLILDKLKNYTKYLYFHIMGEPLMHPKINELIKVANSNNFNINITTNGYLIEKITNKNIRQINISLHSYNPLYKVSLNTYLDNIFNTIDNLDNTYFSLRLWVKNKYTNKILEYINNKYNTNIREDDLNKNIKLKDKVFINPFHEFIWPDLNNDYYEKDGTCYAIKDHIGILSNGTVVPCCLDSKGIINLGNIYKDNLNDILNSKRVLNMLNNFKNKNKVEELCKHCKFL